MHDICFANSGARITPLYSGFSVNIEDQIPIPHQVCMGIQITTTATGTITTTTITTTTVAVATATTTTTTTTLTFMLCGFSIFRKMWSHYMTSMVWRYVRPIMKITVNISCSLTSVRFTLGPIPLAACHIHSSHHIYQTPSTPIPHPHLHPIDDMQSCSNHYRINYNASYFEGSLRWFHSTNTYKYEI